MDESWKKDAEWKKPEKNKKKKRIHSVWLPLYNILGSANSHWETESRTVVEGWGRRWKDRSPNQNPMAQLERKKPPWVSTGVFTGTELVAFTWDKLRSGGSVCPFSQYLLLRDFSREQRIAQHSRIRQDSQQSTHVNTSAAGTGSSARPAAPRSKCSLQENTGTAF